MTVYVVGVWSGSEYGIQGVYKTKERMLKDWSGKGNWTYWRRKLK